MRIALITISKKRILLNQIILFLKPSTIAAGHSVLNKRSTFYSTLPMRISPSFDHVNIEFEVVNNLITSKVLIQKELSGTPIYKFLLSEFYPFITSRIQASEFVRNKLIFINDKSLVGEPHKNLQIGDIVTVAFNWRDLLRERLGKTFLPVITSPGTVPEQHVALHTHQESGGIIEPISDSSELHVVWKAPGTSPLHVLEALAYHDIINGCTYKSLEEIKHIFKGYSENNPSKISTANLAYNVEKSIGGLCLVVLTKNSKAETPKSTLSSNIVRCYHALCHGRLEGEAITKLEGCELKINIDRGSIVYSEASPGSSSPWLSEFKFYTSSIVPGTLLRVKFMDCGVPIVGNGKHAVPLPNLSKKGFLMSLIGLSFFNHSNRCLEYYEHTLPSKFQGILAKEASFAEKKKARDSKVLLEAGINQLDNTSHQELADGKPVAYLLGEKNFFGNTFQVNTSTLIPRVSSECLVQCVIDLFDQHFRHKSQEFRILDIGTGCGCLLLSCLKALPGSVGVGIDISLEVLDLAKENAITLGLEGRSTFMLGDFTYPDLKLEQCKGFDVIICNPPYLPTPRGPAGIIQRSLRYEPSDALFTQMTTIPSQDKVPQSYIDLGKLDKAALFNPNSLWPALVLEVGKSVGTKGITEVFNKEWFLDSTHKDQLGFERCWLWRPRIDSLL